jgi:hypothetical protein
MPIETSDCLRHFGWRDFDSARLDKNQPSQCPVRGCSATLLRVPYRDRNKVDRTLPWCPGLTIPLPLIARQCATLIQGTILSDSIVAYDRTPLPWWVVRRRPVPGRPVQRRHPWTAAHPHLQVRPGRGGATTSFGDTVVMKKPVKQRSQHDKEAGNPLQEGQEYDPVEEGRLEQLAWQKDRERQRRPVGSPSTATVQQESEHPIRSRNKPQRRTETACPAHAHLEAMPLAERVAAVAADVVSKQDEYRSINSHELARPMNGREPHEE